LQLNELSKLHAEMNDKCKEIQALHQLDAKHAPDSHEAGRLIDRLKKQLVSITAKHTVDVCEADERAG
jgi:hypothetical protein